MNNNIQVTIYVATLKNMTDEQFAALRDQVLADGLWENARGLNFSASSDLVTVCPLTADGDPMIYLGIEKDGYTHS